MKTSLPLLAPQGTRSCEPPAFTGTTADFLVPLRATGMRIPLYCVPGLGGHATSFAPLAQALNEQQPVLAFQAQGLEDDTPPHASINAMIAAYVAVLQKHQPAGPYVLGGWSLGGLVALGMAQQLTEQGAEVPLVFLFDTHLEMGERLHADLSAEIATSWMSSHLGLSSEVLGSLTLVEQWSCIASRAQAATVMGSLQIARLARVCEAQLQALAGYVPVPYHGRTVLLRAARYWEARESHWSSTCPNLLRERVAGDHHSMLRSPHVHELARRMEARLVRPAP